MPLKHWLILVISTIASLSSTTTSSLEALTTLLTLETSKNKNAVESTLNESYAEVLDLVVGLRESQEASLKTLEKSIVDFERSLTRLSGDIAYADTPLSTLKLTPPEFEFSPPPKLPPSPNNTTLISRTQKTAVIFSNWRIAPLYASVSLLTRWFYKSLSIPLLPITILTQSIKSLKLIPSSSPSSLQKKWKKAATTGTFRRSLEIWGCALTFVLKERRLTRRRKKIGETEYSKRRRELGKEATETLLKLGPTFIKVGQLLSTRIDIVPKEYIEELKKLQDDVPGFPGETAERIFEEETGVTVHEAFDTFSSESLAAASLGQVHIATKGSQKFAVKIQRQYLRELFEVDLRNLKGLAVFLDAVDPKAEGSLLDANCERDWVSIYTESKRLLFEEISYTNERKNCDLFRENFSDKRFSHIRVPKTYPEYSTEKVLCMEYVPGVKITDLEGIKSLGLDPVEIGIKSAEAYLEQLCRHGFFHCDPHPGNVAIEKDSSGNPRLIFYDFGMMDTFPPVTRKAFIDFLFAFYENQPREACNALSDLGILRDDPNIDRIAVERVGKDFMDRFQATLNTDGEWDNQASDEEKRAINKSKRAKLGEEFLTMNSDVPFIFPPTWTFVFRAFMSLDGIGKTLDPKYDMTKIAKPYLKELIDLKDGNAFKTVSLKIAKRFGFRPIDLNMAVTQPRRTAFVEDVVRRLEQGDFKLRVRALETERALERTTLVQSNVFNAVVSGVLLNSAMVLAVMTNLPGVPARPAKIAYHAARALAVGAAIFGVQVPLGVKRVRNLDAYFEKFGQKKR
ncbi:hypothetical protein TrVE_jg10644 [Triparma verrucosa]|uniref:ABC1 atypical kinase-like domain-containing protein n=1 Tax=Triparma verrucosa TaxID=1606542 RepID=A0A9W7CK17_9STRA|nr:hypothetical protein TrVE_jg10644 [Triparma verrucosa]